MRWVDGSEIGRNERCRCGSSAKLKDCCIALLEHRENHDPDPHLGVYVTSRDLWPSKRITTEDARALARQFDALDLTETLAKIGFVVHKGYSNRGGAVEADVLQRFLPPAWLRKVQLWLQYGGRVKVVHRLAIPAAIQLVMSESQAAGARHPVQGHEELVGQLLLHLNSVLETDYEVQRNRTSGEDAQRALIAANVYRLAFYSDTEPLGPALARQWAIVKKGLTATASHYPAEYVDFEAEFTRCFEFSFDTLTAITMALLSHYEELFENPNRRAEDFFVAGTYFQGAHSPEVRERASSVLTYLSRDWNQHADRIRGLTATRPDNLLQFFSLYERPMLRVASEAVFPLDMSYLNAAVGEGSYWALFQALLSRPDKQLAEKLRSCFGRGFEWYASELLRDAFPQTEPRSAWLDWDGHFPRDFAGSIPDAVILEGDTAFVIEMTASGVPPAIAASCEPERLESALKSIWFGRGPSRESAKLRQLNSAAEAISSGALALPGLAPGSIQRVIPILLTLRPVPRNRLLTQWYSQIQLAEGLPGQFVSALTLLDPGELEELTKLKRGGVRWAELWEERRRSIYAEDSFHNYLYYSGRTQGLHPKLQLWVNECFNDLSAQVYGTRPFPPSGPAMPS